MNKFEIGDKVIVLPNEHPSGFFSEGELLVVRNVDGELVAVSREGDELTPGNTPQNINVNGWFASRFREATPAEKVGLVIGNKYEVIKNVGENGRYFRVGEIVEFYADDGSSSPMFKYTSRSADQHTYPEGSWHMDVSNVEPYVKPVERAKTPAEEAGFVVGKQYVAVKDVDGGDIFKKGEVAIFARDDGSTCPSFKYLKRDSDQSESYDDEWYAYLEDFAEIPNTTIVFDKVLTEAQIAAIRTLVG